MISQSNGTHEHGLQVNTAEWSLYLGHLGFYDIIGYQDSFMNGIADKPLSDIRILE